MATLRQQMVVRKILEKTGDGGLKRGVVSKAMKEVGYSDAMAKNPQDLIESDGFKALMEKYLPDDLLAKVHKEGLEANKIVSARAKTKHGDPMNADEDTDDFIEVPDHPTRGKFLELGYKVKGKLTGDATSPTNIIVPIIVYNAGDKLPTSEGETEDNRATPEAV